MLNALLRDVSTRVARTGCAVLQRLERTVTRVGVATRLHQRFRLTYRSARSREVRSACGPESRDSGFASCGRAAGGAAGRSCGRFAGAGGGGAAGRSGGRLIGGGLGASRTGAGGCAATGAGGRYRCS